MKKPFPHCLSDGEQNLLVKEKQPDWVKPMLATLTHDHFDDPNWIFERKLDGQRCLVFKKGDEVSLFSRNQNPQNSRFPELVPALLAATNKDFIADGEIVAMIDGVSSFAKLQPRMQSSRADLSVPIKLYLFDLIQLDGFNLTQLPVRTRKGLLKSALSFETPLRYTPHRNEAGLAYLKEACLKGWEGLIAKAASSTYTHSRSKQWLKFKCENRQEFVIGGYTEPQGERIGFGALLVGHYDNQKLSYAGKVGTGFSHDFLKELRERLDQRLVESSPFEKHSPTQDESIHWVKPELVGEVSFTEWTSSEKLRHPSFVGLRSDKDPTSVVKE